MDGYEKIYELTAQIPRGRVATYGQLAALLGTPRAARMVGMALSRLPTTSPIPWQRVVNARGMISIENLSVPKAEQAARLQAEGIAVRFKDGNYWVDLRQYLWQSR